MKRLIQKLLKNRVNKAKVELKGVGNEVLHCIRNMHRQDIVFPENEDVILGYCYTRLSKLRRKEEKLTKFIERWELK